MKTKITFAFLAAALAGGLLSSCYVAQPAFECSPATSGYWANYTLISGTAGGACSAYTGDVIRAQRYLAPGTTNASIAVLARRAGRLTRALSPATGALYRFDPADPTYQKESARGPLKSLDADSSGVCSATLQPTDENLPEVDFAQPDGGTKVIPAVKVKYDYQNFRFINTARFPGTIVGATLNVTLDACEAKYDVLAIWPPVGCETDEDCNPNANLDAGRVAGSGLAAEYAPVCGPDGFCIAGTNPATDAGFTFDDLVKIK
jgi:hypothetical protein